MYLYVRPIVDERVRATKCLSAASFAAQRRGRDGGEAAQPSAPVAAGSTHRQPASA